MGESTRTSVLSRTAFEPSRARAQPKPEGTVALLALRDALGNRAIGSFLQTQLTVGRPDDTYEMEADQVADQVMRMPEPSGTAPAIRSLPSDPGHRVRLQMEEEEPEEEISDAEGLNIQRRCVGCEEEEAGGGMIQRQAYLDGESEFADFSRIPAQASDTGPFAAPPIVHEVLRSPGQPLDPATLAFMEPRFGHDFSQVRVHADTKAAESAELVNALAYTVGRHVVLGEGQPAPATTAGRQLLAHELAHVVQQSRGGSAPGATSSAPHEQDARAAAIAVAAGSPRVNIACGTGVGVARQTVDEVVEVGRDLLEDLGHVKGAELKGEGLRRIADIEDKLKGVAQAGGKRAGAARGLLDQIDDLMDVRARNAQLQLKLAEAREFLQRRGFIERGAQHLRGGADADTILDALDRLRQTQGAESDARRARQLSNQIERLGARHRELEAAGRAAPQMFQAPGKATKSAVETTDTAKGAATKALVKAEETAIKAETKLGSRLATGAGRLGLSMLLPGPEDAIMLMADFAGSYQEAWEIIEQRNTRSGIAMGIAAGMMGLDWEWVQQNVWRRFVTRDVATQVVGAVGKAERSYNDGLVRGYKYGAGHPHRMKNRILREAFTILAQEGYRTDEEGLFTLDTVARVAAVLTPLADDFLRQAAERRQAREKREEEQRRKEAKEWGSVGFKV
jgi:hypothetical protein